MILSKNNRFLLSSIVPLNVANYSYKFLFLALKLLIADSDTKVWYRNSLYFNNISFSVSDIDLTIFTSSKITKLNQLKLQSRVNLIRCFFPMLGEVIFLNKSFRKYFKCINYYEAIRDPFFFKIVSTNKIETYDKEVFLIKMFESDLINLKKNFNSRLKKWNEHLYSVNIKEKVVDGDSALDLIKLISLNTRRVGTISMAEILLEIFNQKTMDNNKELLLICSPVKWIADGLSAINFESQLLSLQKYGNNTHQIVYQHMKWELWGLYTQSLDLDKSQIDPHLYRCIKTIDTLKININLKSDLIRYYNFLLEDLKEL
ncbi:MAG: hypothetical protein HN576_03095 [Bacteriovoracaceae bacterium]|jgi:hypothetical protein|nr:hypothetical protein [Bacteriovoracaceae bacterium]